MKLMSNFNSQIDGLLINVKNYLSISLFLKLEGALNDMAEYATPVAAILGAAISFVVAIKTDSLSAFFAGILWMLILIIFYYIGSKLQKSCQSTIENNPSTVASQDYLDAISLVNLIGVVASVVVGLYLSVKISSFTPLIIGLGVSMVMVYTIWVTLNPALVSTYVKSSSSAGVDAIAILILTNKIYLRANRIFFGLVPTLGAILLGKALYQSFGDPYTLLEGDIYGAIGFVLVLVGLISPFLCYIFFIFSFMILDVLLSILSLGKVQDLASAHTPLVENLVGKPTSVENIKISNKTLMRVIFGVVAAILIVAAIIKGKEFYSEYQAKVKIAQMEAQILKAKEEKIAQEKIAEDERIAKENARILDFVGKARKHLNNSSLDLLLEPDVNLSLRELLRTPENMRAIESYFVTSEKVFESENLILGQGCKDPCDFSKIIIFVDSQTGKVGLAVNADKGVMYFGVDERNAPPFIKKWALLLRN